MYVCIHISHVMYLVCVCVFSVCAVLFVRAGCSHQPDDYQVLSPRQPQRWRSNATCASTRCVQPLATDVCMDPVNIDHLTGQSLSVMYTLTHAYTIVSAWGVQVSVHVLQLFMCLSQSDKQAISADGSAEIAGG